MTTREADLVTHREAKQIVAPYSEEALLAILRKGHADPASLSADEVRAGMAYVWLREMRKQN